MRLKSNSLHLNQLKLLIIREYCMLTYDRISQGSLSFIHQTDHL